MSDTAKAICSSLVIRFIAFVRTPNGAIRRKWSNARRASARPPRAARYRRPHAPSRFLAERSALQSSTLLRQSYNPWQCWRYQFDKRIL